MDVLNKNWKSIIFFLFIVTGVTLIHIYTSNDPQNKVSGWSDWELRSGIYNAYFSKKNSSFTLKCVGFERYSSRYEYIIYGEFIGGTYPNSYIVDTLGESLYMGKYLDNDFYISIQGYRKERKNGPEIGDTLEVSFKTRKVKIHNGSKRLVGNLKLPTPYFDYYFYDEMNSEKYKDYIKF